MRLSVARPVRGFRGGVQTTPRTGEVATVSIPDRAWVEVLPEDVAGDPITGPFPTSIHRSARHDQRIMYTEVRQKMGR
jgi:hypothetical protein